jgi:hypothetical protein
MLIDTIPNACRRQTPQRLGLLPSGQDSGSE